MTTTAIHWKTQINADFSTAADWTGGHVPGKTNDAILDAAGATAYTVTASTSQTVASIQTAKTATLAITGGVFTALKGAGAGANAGTIQVGDNATFSMAGTLNNTGQVSLNSGGDITEFLVGAAGATLSGKGQVTLGDSTANLIVGAGATATLTNLDNIISGAGSLGGGKMTLANQLAGIIDATGANALIINTGAQAIANAGLIQSLGTGGLVIQSAVANTGRLIGDGAGALVIQNATVSGIGGTVYALANGLISLQAGAISGETVTVAAGGALNVDGGGKTGASALTFTGTTSLANQGQITLNDNVSLTLQGSVVNGGTISLATQGNPTSLIVGAAGVTLSGKGALVLGDSTANTVIGATAAATLTNVDNTITGAGAIGVGLMTLANQTAGVIDATGANALTINTGAQAIANAGLIEATGQGALIAQSAITNSGTLAGAGVGALVLQSATVTNTGGVISALNGGHVSLQGETVTGGAVSVAAGGALTVDGGGASGASAVSTVTFTNLGQVTLNDNVSLTFQGAVTNSGTISLATQGNPTSLIVGAGGLTLSGKGALVLGDSTANTVIGATAAATLTNVDNTISGGGNLGGGQMTISNGKSGTIDATGANALVIDTGTAVIGNAGLIEATGSGGLSLTGSTVNNGSTGVILAGAGTQISLQSDRIIGGALESLGSGFFQTTDTASVLDGSTAGGAVAVLGPITLNDNTALTLQGSIANTGSISLNSQGNNTDLIIGASNVTLTGNGQVLLDDALTNRVIGATAASRLVNIASKIIGAGQVGAGRLILVNQTAGIIEQNGANSLTVNTGKAVITNAGLMADGGQGDLVIQSAVSNTGTLAGFGAGALALQNASVNQTAAGQLTTSTGGHISLQTASVTGGAVMIVKGAQLTIDAGGKTAVSVVTAATFTNQGAVIVNDNTALALQGTVANSGTISLATLGNATRLIVGAGGLTLSGGGALSLSDSTGNIVTGATATALLTNIDNLISGAGSLGGAKMALSNGAAGIIDATGANALVLAAASVSNAGLIEATGSGGLTIENSRIDGSSGGSISDGAGSSVTLLGGVIAGGTLTGAGVVQTAGFASGLSGVASTVVNLTTVQVNDGTSLTLSGAIANKSGILLNSAGNTTTLVVGTAGATLSGGGQIKLDDTTTNLVTGQGGLSTLTNVDNTILGAGTLGGAGLVLSNGAAGIINATGANALTIATGSTVTNAGQIFASGAGGLVILDDVANTGVLNVFGSGDLTLGGVVTNGPGGAIHAGDGSTVVLAGAVISGGTLSTTGSGVITCATALGTGANTLDGTTATVVNKAAIVLNGIANLVLQGNIDNAGSIADGLSVLTINGDTVLTGHGSILLGLGSLSGGSAGFSPLINVDNTISGVGSIGGATDSLVLVNQSAGVIDGVGSAGLTIDTGDSAILNSGLIEATTGHVNVDSAVNNRGGVLEADGATLHLFGLVSNTGQVIDKSGTVEMAAANETAGVAFTGTNGTLLLDNSQTYTGQVSGFSHKGGTLLDLTDIAFTSGVTTASFSGNTSGGTLTVTDGTHTAHIALAGDYTTSAFVAASDGNGGTLIHDPAKAPVHVYVPINPSAHAFAQALATFGAASSSGVSLGAAPPIHQQIQLSVGHGAHLS